MRVNLVSIINYLENPEDLAAGLYDAASTEFDRCHAAESTWAQNWHRTRWQEFTDAAKYVDDFARLKQSSKVSA